MRYLIFLVARGADLAKPAVERHLWPSLGFGEPSPAPSPASTIETDVKCSGSQMEVKACSEQSCSLPGNVFDCEWSDWQGWGSCSCLGLQERARVISRYPTLGGKLCNGAEKTVRDCTPECGDHSTISRNCEFSPWTEYSDCTRSCGPGQRFRSREILKHAQNLGSFCTGSTHEVQPCNRGQCYSAHPSRDCQWGLWVSWSACSHSCLGGQQSRERSVLVASRYGGKLCEGAATREVRGCNTQECADKVLPVDCEFADWESWSTCPVTCGGASRSRERTVLQHVGDGGQPCEGDLVVTEKCNTRPCKGHVTDCEFNAWSSFSDCSSDCNGKMEQTRQIRAHAQGPGGRGCHGAIRRVEPCNVHAGSCAAQPSMDCLLSEWKQWTSCSATCDEGQQTRTREIEENAIGLGKPCAGDTDEIRACTASQCKGETARNCVWETWSDWENCSVSCGTGQQRRHRTVRTHAKHSGMPCSGVSVELGVCSHGPCRSNEYRTCDFGAWENWETCSRSCDGGTRTRAKTRAITVGDVPPNDSSLLIREGEICGGTVREVQPCGAESCNAGAEQDCEWDAWSRWSSCPCHGLQEHNRVIKRYAKKGGKPCEGSEVESRPCLPACLEKQDCEYGSWSAWSACSTTCGQGGRMNRVRIVTRYEAHGGAKCVGESNEKRECGEDIICPIPRDCLWSEWQVWSNCSKSCGGGQRTRHRMIATEAQAGGAECEAKPSVEMGGCNDESCNLVTTVDCKFSDWGEWSNCSKSCDTGERSRQRSIEKEPVDNGKPCVGPMREFGPCGTDPCTNRYAVNCELSGWSDWGMCSCACNGLKSRLREVTTRPQYGGKGCTCALQELEACNLDAAECELEKEVVDCVFSEWSEYGPCSKSCGVGQRFRDREIKVEARGLEAVQCLGPTKEIQECVESRYCMDAHDCEHGEWQMWSACSASCDGQKWRHRVIKHEHTLDGLPCKFQDTSEYVGCNTEGCDTLGFVCMFDMWSPWTACSLTCQGGEKTRTRQLDWVTDHQAPILQEKEYENALADQRSPTPTPPRVPHSSEGVAGPGWFEEGQRRLAHASKVRPSWCDVTQLESNRCNDIPCSLEKLPVNCLWSEWSKWNSCDCTGLRDRHRHIRQTVRHGGVPCVGPEKVTQKCIPTTCGKEAVNCELDNWSEWSGCSVSCGGGQHQRSRVVLTHSHGDKAKGCTGHLDEVEPCGSQACPGITKTDCSLTPWTEWTFCSSPCRGTKHRERKVESDAENGGQVCLASDLLELEPCNVPMPGLLVPACDVSVKQDCVWSVWAPFNLCSHSCGGGRQHRVRSIAKEQSHGGKSCVGAFEDWKVCNDVRCPGKQACSFQQWGSWGDCSNPCNGYMARTREVNPAMTDDAPGCSGPTRQFEACNVHSADCATEEVPATDCLFSFWSIWGDCSLSCGGGQQYRTRMVQAHAEGSGKPCKGYMKEITACNTFTCVAQLKQDCRWAAWDLWSDCSRTCDGGQKRRERNIVADARYGGKPCDFKASMELFSCNTHPCQGVKFCVWGQYGIWSQCSTTCGGGEATRTRTQELVDSTLLTHQTMGLSEISGYVDSHGVWHDVGEPLSWYPFAIGVFAFLGIVFSVFALLLAMRKFWGYSRTDDAYADEPLLIG
eukprot:GEMP01000944.1.p1 GENE.GEMP01000944.1~~GEMP01000944.1.p1  ORF type:complete len:1628 (+),score=304.02 GEMP01000944.1:2-4885(+)